MAESIIETNFRYKINIVQVYCNNVADVTKRQDLPVIDGYKAIGIVGMCPINSSDGLNSLTKYNIDIDANQIVCSWGQAIPTNIGIDFYTLYVKE